MRRNVEIKAWARGFERQLELARASSDAPEERLHQQDTYFHCANGRLKLRTTGGPDGLLVQYLRADSVDPAESGFRVCAVPDAALLREALAQALGIRGVVTKRRTVVRIGRTRVHFDDVDDLGRFLELEVVMADDEPAAAGELEARELMARLEIPADSLVDGSYIDLLSSHGR